MKKNLLLATRNPYKKKELQEILAHLDINIIGLDELGAVPEVEEDGLTFEENALKKAGMTAAMTGYMCLADDSGLVVDFLGGKPGIYSARFAGEKASDEENNQKLLDMLAGVPPENRTARFVCVIAICDPQGRNATVAGCCKGKILPALQGKAGFGYDPLFVPDGYKQTFAELSAEEKNKISHRGKALVKAVPIIEEFLRWED